MFKFENSGLQFLIIPSDHAYVPEIEGPKFPHNYLRKLHKI